MKLFLTLILVCACLDCALAETQLREVTEKQAGEAASLRPAQELLALIEVEEMMQSTSQAVFAPYLKRLKEIGYPDAAVDEINQAANAFFAKIATDPELKENMMALYEKEFTDEELRQVVAFYKTPSGQKTLKRLPLLFKEGAKLGETYAQKYSESYKQEVSAIMEKYQDQVKPPVTPSSSNQVK